MKLYYDSLQKVLDKFTYISELESDSSNILKLVKTGYEEIVSVINFKDDLEDDSLKLKYFSDCGIENGPMIETKKCKGVEFGQVLNFEVQISLDTCNVYEKVISKILQNTIL